MAELLRSKDAYDPIRNIREWQLQQLNVQPGDYIEEASLHNEIAELSSSLLALFKEVVLALSEQTEIPKDARISIERSRSALILWSDGFGVAQGRLNDIFNKSRKLRYTVFKNLLHIGRVLVERLVPVVNISSEKLQVLCSSVQSSIEAASGLVSQESCRESDDSSSDGASTFSDDDIYEIAEDLKTDTFVLSSLEPLFKSPIFDSRLENAVDGIALSLWSPEKTFSDKIENRFPCADAPLTSHLGRANYERYLRCQATRDSQEDGEPLPVTNEERNRSGTLVAETKFHDSGVGTSIALTMSYMYAETTMSYNHDGQSIPIPPLSKEAKTGLPFICIACGRTVVITNNSAWKRHIYLDLQPYMCLDISCPYNSSTFESHEKWISHLALDHEMEPKWESTECPLCREETGSGKTAVTRHLSKHLEEISLSALPVEVDSNAESEISSEPSDARSSLHERPNGSVDEDQEAPPVKYNANLTPKDYSNPEVNIIAGEENLARIEVKSEAAQGAAESDAAEAESYKKIQEESSSNIEEAVRNLDETAEQTKLAPIRFKDAVGRKFIFPFHLCHTWQGMEDLIKQACLKVDVLGPHVQEGRYDLSGPNGDIILPGVWEKVVEPGWDITMTMWLLEKVPPAGMDPKIYMKPSTEEKIREKSDPFPNRVNSKDGQNFFASVKTYFKDQPDKFTRFRVILTDIAATEWVPEAWRRACFECRLAEVHCDAKSPDPCTRCRLKKFSCVVQFAAVSRQHTVVNSEQIRQGIINIGRLCDGYPSFMHELNNVLPSGYRVEVIDASTVRLFAPDNEPTIIQEGISEQLTTVVDSHADSGMESTEKDKNMPGTPDAPNRFPCWCRAIYSWGGQSKRDLRFIEGDLIECLNAGDGSWWVGRLFRDRKTVGSFPSNYVEVLPEDFQPIKSPSPIPPNIDTKAPHYTTAKRPETFRYTSPSEMAKLVPAERTRINELATKLMNQATEEQRANTRLYLQSKLSPEQLAEIHAQGKNPLLWWYQHQAFQALKQSSQNSQSHQGGPANQNSSEAGIVQQGHTDHDPSQSKESHQTSTHSVTETKDSSAEHEKFGLSESYVSKVKHRFIDSPHIYKQFIEILQDIPDDTQSAQDAYVAAKELFGSNSDLIDEFQKNLPRAIAAGMLNKANQRKRVETILHWNNQNDLGEPQYCLCNRGSSAIMIRCDNVDSCKFKWFHLECVGLAVAPSSKDKWYCPDCRSHLSIVEKEEIHPPELGNNKSIPSIDRINYPHPNRDIYIWPPDSNDPGEEESEHASSSTLPPPLPPPIIPQSESIDDHGIGNNDIDFEQPSAFSHGWEMFDREYPNHEIFLASPSPNIYTRRLPPIFNGSEGGNSGEGDILEDNSILRTLLHAPSSPFAPPVSSRLRDTRSRGLPCEAEPLEKRLCFQSFADKKTRDRHYWLSHEEYAKEQGVPETTYVCKYCGVSFSRQDNFRRHVKIRHPTAPIMLSEEVQPSTPYPSRNTFNKDEPVDINEPSVMAATQQQKFLQQQQVQDSYSHRYQNMGGSRTDDIPPGVQHHPQQPQEFALQQQAVQQQKLVASTSKSTDELPQNTTLQGRDVSANDPNSEAALTAGLEENGVDPNVVIDDPESYPASNKSRRPRKSSQNPLRGTSGSSDAPNIIYSQAPDDKLLEALASPRDRLFLLRLEKDVVNFIQDSKEPYMDLPPSNSFCRMLTHKLADYYYMTHSYEPHIDSVRIFRTTFCQIPPSLATMIPQTTVSTSREEALKYNAAEESSRNLGNESISEPPEGGSKRDGYPKLRGPSDESDRDRREPEILRDEMRSRVAQYEWQRDDKNRELFHAKVEARAAQEPAAQESASQAKDVSSLPEEHVENGRSRDSVSNEPFGLHHIKFLYQSAADFHGDSAKKMLAPIRTLDRSPPRSLLSGGLQNDRFAPSLPNRLSAPVSESEPNRTQNDAARKTKGHVASTCLPCKMAHLRCEGKRPCSRCLDNGKEDICVDIPQRKRTFGGIRGERDAKSDPTI